MWCPLLRFMVKKWSWSVKAVVVTALLVFPEQQHRQYSIVLLTFLNVTSALYWGGSQRALTTHCLNISLTYFYYNYY